MKLKPKVAAPSVLLVLLACSGDGQRGQQDAAGGVGGGGGSSAVAGTGGRAGSGGTAQAGGGPGAGGRGAGGAGPDGGGAGKGGAVGSGGRTGAGGAATRDAASESIVSRDAGAEAATDTASPERRDAATDGQPDRPAVADGGCPVPGPGKLATSTTHLNVGVHDPALMSDGKKLYLFATGGTLSIRSSDDGLQWSNAGKVFASVPTWITSTLGVSATDFELWAPDISFFGCKYRLYYAGSVFGKNTSVIGLASSATLDPSSPGYGFSDDGLILQSKSSDSFNAIDPHVSFDEVGNPWLSFGSFWDGIKMRRLDPATGKLSSADTTLYALASRKGTGDAIEAPSIVAHNGYYYLFVSFDTCCKGVDSTYRSMVGRAGKITGPYADKAGTAMTKGAAEELLATSGRYIGPGGGTAFQNGEAYYYAFHYYDGNDNGASKLQIRPVTFGSDDWPVLGDPLFP